MIDLWTLLVVNLFQGFWLAVFGIAGMMFMILMIGRVSAVTTYNFLTIFFLAMAIGYGYTLFSILLIIGIFIIQFLAATRFVNS